jgi:hypothetical protein
MCVDQDALEAMRASEWVGVLAVERQNPMVEQDSKATEDAL